MSQRHRSAESQLLPRKELRAKKHSERHRMGVELDQVAKAVSAGVDPEDLHEPGSAWKASRHQDSERAKKKLAAASKRNLRHWKVRSWKRRAAERQRKIERIEMIRRMA